MASIRGESRRHPSDSRRESERLILKSLNEGEKTYTGLVRETKLSEPTIAKRLDSLEKGRMILHRINPTDRRSKIYSITPHGRGNLSRLEVWKTFWADRDVEEVVSLLQSRLPEATGVTRTAESIEITAMQVRSSFMKKVQELSGQNITSCYICGKCSSGCPITSLMDTRPHQVMRLIQLGQEDEVLASRTIWLCTSCFTCASRCPRGINLTTVMEALRTLVLRRGEDRVSPSKLPRKLLAEAPQLAIVSYFRKLSS
jgi:heterodisulfide reductase subunit C